MEIANETQRPITIHCVQAWGQLLNTLSQTRVNHSPPFILHSFGGSHEIVPPLIKLGAFFSIGINIPPKSIQAVSKEIPWDRLLVETDGPTSSDTGEWIHVDIQIVCEQIALLRGVTKEEVARITGNNFKRLFRLK